MQQLLLTFITNICIVERRTALHVLTYLPSVKGKYVDSVLMGPYAASFGKELPASINC
jgi:hypothetical protein